MPRKTRILCIDGLPVPSKKRLRRAESDDDDDDESDDAGSGGLDLTKLFSKQDEKDVYRRDNHIYFKTDVSMSSVEKLLELIREINQKFEKIRRSCKFAYIKPKPIWLHISSYGGDCYACRLAIDYIKSSKIPVYTVGEGYIMSAGAMMFVVGKKRFMTEQTVFLMHQLRGSLGGTFHDMTDEVQHLTALTDQAVKIFKDHSKMLVPEIKEQLKREEKFDFAKCKKKGLVDDSYLMNEEELEQKYYLAVAEVSAQQL